MQENHQLRNTIFTSIGIASSLLIAMLCIEFMIVGNFENILAYSLISVSVSSIYLISMIVTTNAQKRAQRENAPQAAKQPPL